MTRSVLVRLPFAALLASTIALAEPAKEATSPCVNRENIAWRQVRDAKLDGKSLLYCTGEDCWALDLAANTVAAAPRRPASGPRTTESGKLTGDGGAVLATATESHVSFCPGGPSSCKQFDYKLASPPASGIYPVMNRDGTLGAVIAHGTSEEGGESYVLAFDLAKGKLVKQVSAKQAQVLRTGFVVDDVFYSAAYKKVGKLAVADHGWEAIAGTDLVALHDTKKGAIVIQDGATAKVKARVPLGVADRETWFTLVSSSDGAKLYAIGSKTDEGEVVTIDVATGKVAGRATPAVCAAGTHRVN
jgi:DNA-binding beta-propeller fold protein YncE